MWDFGADLPHCASNNPTKKYPLSARVFTSTYARYTHKIGRVSVFETSHHGEVGDENENPTIVGLCS
jgi:hypothetical protein